MLNVALSRASNSAKAVIQCIRRNHKPRRVFIFTDGSVRTAQPGTSRCNDLEAFFIECLVGTYDENSTTIQIAADIREHVREIQGTQK